MNYKRILPILEQIQGLTVEEREVLFIALDEEYEWVPEHGAIIGDNLEAWGGDNLPKDYDVILTREGREQLPVLRLIRKNCNLDPKESKALLSSLPAVIKYGLDKEEAMKLQEGLLACGAQAEICESTHTQMRLDELKGEAV